MTFQGAEVKRKSIHPAAKDFSIKTTYKNTEDPETHEGKVIIFRNGKPVFTSTINFNTAYEMVKRLMLQLLYIKTLEVPELVESYSSFEDYAKAETINGAKLNAEQAAHFEKCLRNQSWMNWFEGIAAEATQSMLDNLAQRIMIDYLLLESEAARYALNHTFFPSGIAQELDKGMVKIIKAFESKQIGKRAGVRRGGDRKSEPEWREAETLKQYKRKVNELRPLWEFITKFYAENYDDEGWMNMLRESSHFKALSQDCHTIPPELLKRLAGKGSDKREREPLALALEHARRELTLPIRSSATLRGYYTGRRSKGSQQ
jgi:hypothetical protein